ncbi:MAG: hypothetical protein KIT79_14545 [Deltaproteobacteria bacterium]|nr:hypothetical protein [Deltaproteobacteria bacterium]
MKISKRVCTLLTIALIGSGCPSGTSAKIVNRSGNDITYHIRSGKEIIVREGRSITFDYAWGSKIQKGETCYMYEFLEGMDTLVLSSKYKNFIRTCRMLNVFSGYSEFVMILDQSMRVFVSDDCNRIRYSEEQPEGFPVSPEIVPCD